MKQDKHKIFCDCEDKERHDQLCLLCSDPDMVIQGLKDAKEAMNYSNWANDKLDRAIECVKQYCKDNEIPMRWVE